MLYRTCMSPSRNTQVRCGEEGFSRMKELPSTEVVKATTSGGHEVNITLNGHEKTLLGLDQTLGEVILPRLHSQSSELPCSVLVPLHMNRGLKAAYWLKHWTADRKVQGSSPTCSRDLFLFRVHSALPQKLSNGTLK